MGVLTKWHAVNELRDSRKKRERGNKGEEDENEMIEGEKKLETSSHGTVSDLSCDTFQF